MKDIRTVTAPFTEAGKGNLLLQNLLCRLFPFHLLAYVVIFIYSSCLLYKTRAANLLSGVRVTRSRTANPVRKEPTA